MTVRDPLFEFMPYGAPELRDVARRYQLRALLLACALAAFCFALAAGIGAVSTRASQPPHVVDLSISVVAPPPPLAAIVPPAPVPVAPAAHPPADLGVPTPVSDALAPETPAPAAGDLGDGPIDPNAPVGPPVLADPGAGVSPEPPDWREFQPVDVLPAVVREVKPPYPDDAHDLGIEGRVLVHVLVGLDGHVIRAEADPRITAPLLEHAAVEAARAWVFTPALANGHPVKAWATIPFNFTLR